MGRRCVIRAAVIIGMVCLAAGCEREKTDDGNNLPGTVTVSPNMDEKDNGNHEAISSPNGYTEYRESPVWQEGVAKGELQVAEKRLPKQEDVMELSLPQIGAYGGEAQFAAENADTVTRELVSEGLFCYAADGTLAPNIAKAYRVNSDFTEYTIYLREGMRWSDGVLFTSDDCIFFYEKLCLPEVFGEALWSCFISKDASGRTEKAVFTKLDRYSFRINFSSSKPEFLSELLAQGGICFAPEHYFVNLLPEYMGEDAAAAKAKDMGYTDTDKMLKETVSNAWNTPGVPTLNPFCISTEEGKGDVRGSSYEFVRNPYYWKTDEAGKQLPYLDKLVFTRISGETQKMLLTTEGYLTVSALHGEQVGEARSMTDRGNYRLITWQNFSDYAVKNGLKNFPEGCPYEARVRGIGAAHVEGWYME